MEQLHSYYHSKRLYLCLKFLIDLMSFNKGIQALVIFMLSAGLAQAQPIHLHGRVTDAQTGQPISAATISIAYKRLFFPTDSAGKFSITSNSLTKSDSVAFSCIGYKTVKMLVGEIDSNVVIKLLAQVNMLGEVMVGTAEPAHVNVGSKAKGSKLSVWQHVGEDKATFMEGSKNVKGIIRSVGFYLSNGHGALKGGDVTAPFRIRLFRVDSVGKPGREITNDIIVASANKDDAWFDFDLSSYRIHNPDSGFFAVFSLLSIEYYKLKPEARTNGEHGNKNEPIDTGSIHPNPVTENPADLIAPRLGVNSFTLAKPRSFHSVPTTQNMTSRWEPEYNNWEYLIRATIEPD